MEADKLGPYQIIGKLGEGGMGAVFKGVDPATGQLVAVKLLPQSLAGQEGFRFRFDSEIETLRKLEHENIVGLYGFGEDHGQLYYSMEFVDGVSIQDEIKRGKRFGWRSVVDLGIQLCRALKHAHDRGVIHRDIKPANIMLADDGVAKLTDFGIAKLYGNVSMTMTGGPIGTATYMSPEQAEGNAVNLRSDIYALGGTFYCMLAGRPPFVADSLMQMLKYHRSVEPEPLSRYAPDVPAELELVITNMLQKDPKDRIANAMMLTRALKGVADAMELQNPGAASDPPSGLSSSQHRSSPQPGTSPGTMDRAIAEHMRNQPDGQTHLPKTTVGVPDLADATSTDDTPDSTASLSSAGGTTANVPDEDPDTTAELGTDELEETLASEAGVSDPLSFESSGQVGEEPQTVHDDLTLDSNIGSNDDQTLASHHGGSDDTQIASPTQMQRYADQDAEGDTYDLAIDDSDGAGHSSASRARQIASIDPNNETIRGESVFVTAEQAAEYERLREEEERRLQPRIIPVKTILLVLALVVGIPVLYFLVKPHSADELYAEIQSIDALSDEATSSDREIADIYIRDFRRRFPSDPRADELADLAEEIEIASMQVPSALKRMYQQADDFVKLEPEKALLMFEAMVNLYNDPTLNLSNTDRRYYDRAIKRVDDLNRIVQEVSRNEGAVLSKRLNRAAELETKNPAVAKAIALSVVELYSDRKWASEFVDKANDLLTRLPEEVAPAPVEEPKPIRSVTEDEAEADSTSDADTEEVKSSSESADSPS